MTMVELTGLKGHHPLGFLAACGAMCLCESAELSWVLNESNGYIATLRIKRSGSNAKRLLLAALIRGARRLACEPERWTKRQKIDFTASAFRSHVRAAMDAGNFEGASKFFPSLASDIVVGKNEHVVPTLFDCTSGNQRFLKSLAALTASLAKRPKKRRSSKETLTRPSEAFDEAVFGPWRYRDNQHSFGWDPQTQRLHALLRMDPSVERKSQGIPGVRAAVFLASHALPLFPCFAVRGKLRTTGFHRKDDEDWLVWPIWEEPITLDTLRSLLTHPLNNDLKGRGVKVMYRCRRVRTGGAEGNYQVFTTAEERPW